MTRRTRLALFVSVALLAGATAAAPAAQAAAPTDDAIASQVVQMTLDCAGLKGAAKQYAAAHDLCPPNGRAGGGISPANEVPGTCGTSYLYIYNWGGGNARFLEGVRSSLGPISYVSYSVSWTNWSLIGVGGSFGGSAAPFSDQWIHGDTVHTQPGYVIGLMSGWVLLWWGGVCTFNGPSDQMTIT